MAAKKEVKKKSAKSRKKPVQLETKKEDNSQRILIENFVALQKVMADLSGKINDLTSQMSRLLNVFEESAKALTEKGGKVGLGSDKEVSAKLDQLLDQNKILAQGVALLHESNNQEPPQDQSAPMQPMMAPMPNQNPPGQGPVNKYQRSISSKY